MGRWCEKFSNYMGRWCSTKSNYMGGWCFAAWRGKKEYYLPKKRDVLSNLAKKRQINVFDVPTCPTIYPVVGHSNIVNPLLSTWGNCGSRSQLFLMI